MTGGDYADRIAALAARAERHRASFEPPDAPPDEERALSYLREGVGPAVALYVEARTGGGPPVAFDPEDFARLEGAMNDWLALYARCLGREVDLDCTVRTAAELLIETRDVRDVAAVLTGVPEDRRERAVEG